MSITNTDFNNPFPFLGEDQSPEPMIRFLPLPTAQTLREEGLFGIPLYSSLTKQSISDATLEKYIIKAISTLEHQLGIYITPIHFDERHDLTKDIWINSFAWVKLNQAPILDVQEVALSFVNQNALPPSIKFPLELVYVNSNEGAIRLTPALGTTVAITTSLAVAGAQVAWFNMIGSNIYPGAIRVKYRCGFEQDKVPAVIASLLNKMASLEVLSSLGPVLFPSNSSSVGTDGVSQSVSGPGPALFSQRINELKEAIVTETEATKTYYQKRILIDYF